MNVSNHLSVFLIVSLFFVSCCFKTLVFCRPHSTPARRCCEIASMSSTFSRTRRAIRRARFGSAPLHWSATSWRASSPEFSSSGTFTQTSGARTRAKLQQQRETSGTGASRQPEQSPADSEPVCFTSCHPDPPLPSSSSLFPSVMVKVVVMSSPN